ncbi:restriction endonuclease subunit S [Candidatus Thiothrix anitrata]|uniref:Restriction endonuclease subunit S n=1 Tax=Candidatus Thiothrix anitrata TaxID=2823902 RepID=A0ABX7X5D2_9GAMM|nr:restriction endonuclease subunit S [Candidatus Thiothrix anitrata]QTR50038.1 restriction endonuclease subunit S [Candidatus Thiothrix anitrata]
MIYALREDNLLHKVKTTCCGSPRELPKSLKKGTSITQAKTIIGDIPVVAGGISYAYKHNQYNREKNTITISASGANAGFINFWREKIFASDCTTIREKSNIDIVFIFNFLKTIQADIFLLARGSAQPHVYPDDIKNIKIPVPPMEIQQTIVRECEAVDAEYEKAKQVITDGQQTISSTIEQVYRARHSQVEIGKLAIDVQYGISQAMNTTKIGYKIFRMNEIFNNRMTDTGDMKYVDISAEEFQKYRLNKSDILFNRTNSIEWVGKTGIFELDGDYCFASYLIRVVIDTAKAEPYFVNAMMNSATFQTEAKANAARAINQANINASKMKAIKIPVPPLDEQQRIVAEITVLEQKIKAAQAVMDGATARKAAIVKKHL